MFAIKSTRKKSELNAYPVCLWHSDNSMRVYNGACWYQINHRRVSLPKFLLCFFGGVLAFTMPCVASERDSVFYTGLSISSNNAEDGGASSTAIGLSVSGGYDFSQYLGAEISLFNIGDHDELGMQGSGLSIGAIGYYPFADKFSLLGEIGYMSVDIQISEIQNQTLQDGRDSSIFYSFGIRYDLNNLVFSLKNSVVDLDADMNIISGQVRYLF